MIAEHSLVIFVAESHESYETLAHGDIGTVVHVYEDGEGYEVEFIDKDNKSVLATVGADDIRLHDDE